MAKKGKEPKGLRRYRLEQKRKAADKSKKRKTGKKKKRAGKPVTWHNKTRGPLVITHTGKKKERKKVRGDSSYPDHTTKWKFGHERAVYKKISKPNKKKRTGAKGHMKWGVVHAHKRRVSGQHRMGTGGSLQAVHEHFVGKCK